VRGCVQGFHQIDDLAGSAIARALSLALLSLLDQLAQRVLIAVTEARRSNGPDRRSMIVSVLATISASISPFRGVELAGRTSSAERGHITRPALSGSYYHQPFSG